MANNSNSTPSLHDDDERLLETTPSSRCLMVTDNTTATLDFEVTHYEQLKGMPINRYVSSRIFRVGGYDWAILFYLDMFGTSHASAFVHCVGRGDDVRAKFMLNIVENEDQAELSRFDAREHVFSPRKYDWGYSFFVSKSKLSSFSDGCFTIRCVLTVMDEESLPLEMPGHLERALKDGRGTDVTFDVGGMAFSAHRIVLAERSPVFDAQLFGPMKEKDMRRVEVVDMEPVIFEMILHFIYTDSLPPPPCDGVVGHDIAVMQHLLVAADRYGLDRLKLMCEEKLRKIVDMKTVDTTFALADQHGCKRLKDDCLELMSWRMPGFVRTTNRPSMEGRPMLDLENDCYWLSDAPLGSHAYSDGGAMGQEQQARWGIPGEAARGHDGAVPLPETSSSRCLIATENITATLNFEVGNYLPLKSMDTGTYVSSRIFRVGGYDWILRFYPEGKGGAHASAFLYCSGRQSGEQVRAKFALSLLEKEGQAALATFDAIERDFAPGDQEWGYHEFIEKSNLEWLSVFGDVCLTIRCVLTVVIEEPLPLELPDHLERALNSGRGTDVTFHVGGREFSAHRFMLAARSPVFAAELFGATMERDTVRVEVTDMEPAIFKMILHFVYTDLLPPCNGEEGHSDVVMQHLLVAADRYGLGKLKMMCGKRLRRNVDLKTVTTVRWRWKISSPTSGSGTHASSSCLCLEC